MKTWLKRVTTSLLSATLLLSTSVFVFAEPEVNTSAETNVVQSEKEKLTTTDFYLEINYSRLLVSNGEDPDITSITVTGPNGSDTLSFSDLEKGNYKASGIFKIGSYAVGDSLSIQFEGNGETVGLYESGDAKEILKSTPYNYIVEVNSFTTDIVEEFILGSKECPLVLFTEETVSNDVYVTLTDESGNILPNIRVLATNALWNPKKFLTSDEKGVVTIPRDGFETNIKLYITDDAYAFNDESEFIFISAQQSGSKSSVTLKKVETEEEAETSLPDVSFTVNVSYSGKPALFDKSKKGLLELNFSTDRDTFTVGNLAEGPNAISIPKGVYNITSSKDYLPITPLNNIDTDSKEVNVVCTPTYTLRVTNSDNADLRADSFEVININSLKDSKFPYDSDYSVMPGQSIMLRDPVSLKAYNVAIKEGSYTSTVDLASGKIAYSGTTTSGKTNPKTGDAVTIIITIAIIALILIAFLVFYLIKNKKKINGNKLLSLLLALTFVSTSGIFTTKEAYALGYGYNTDISIW